MADKVVELRKTQEEQAPPAVATKPARSRVSLRLMLLVIIPLIALAGGAYFYLASGRYLWNGFMPGPETIWTQVEEVPGGCYAVLDEQHRTPRFVRFWDIGSSLRPASAIGSNRAPGMAAQ